MSGDFLVVFLVLLACRDRSRDKIRQKSRITLVPSPLRCSSTHTAITLRQSPEVADRNARLLAISFSREMLIRRVASIPECKAFSFGILGTSFSVRRRLIVCHIC